MISARCQSLEGEVSGPEGHETALTVLSLPVANTCSAAHGLRLCMSIFLLGGESNRVYSTRISQLASLSAPPPDPPLRRSRARQIKYLSRLITGLLIPAAGSASGRQIIALLVVISKQE